MSQPRIGNPAMIVPDAMPALQALGNAVGKGGLEERTILLVLMRASQINGCGVCLDGHAAHALELDEKPERLATIAAWRDTPYFSDAERAALALTEAVTRLADRPDPVSDEVWCEAARHYDEAQLGSLVISIAAINTWNRINAATRQVTGPWVEQFISREPSAQAA